jgi:hypothetical protein
MLHVLWLPEITIRQPQALPVMVPFRRTFGQTALYRQARHVWGGFLCTEGYNNGREPHATSRMTFHRETRHHSCPQSAWENPSLRPLSRAELETGPLKPTARPMRQRRFEPPPQFVKSLRYLFDFLRVNEPGEVDQNRAEKPEGQTFDSVLLLDSGSGTDFLSRNARYSKTPHRLADDRQLWERICQGDARTFDAFYRENATSWLVLTGKVLSRSSSLKRTLAEIFWVNFGGGFRRSSFQNSARFNSAEIAQQNDVTADLPPG